MTELCDIVQLRQKGTYKYMEIRVLRYFLMIARTESITKAAEALHITQPTLSRQIRELEEEIGTDLFLRDSRKIRLRCS